MSEIVMPRLSDTMEEGTILRWLKADGEQVARGEELVEIETDKATMVYESDQQGVLQIIAAEGATLAVGEPIATVGAAGAAAPTPTPAQAPGEEAPSAAPAPASPAPAVSGRAAAEPGGDGAATPGGNGAATPDGSGVLEPSAAAVADAADGERVKASPLARRIARERGLDLRGVSGSGPGGRIVKADVLGSEPASTPAGEHGARVDAPAAGATATPAAAPAGLGEVATAKGQSTEVALSRTQQTIARRMAESKATIPDFSIQSDVDMELCVQLRGELKRLAPSVPGGAGQPGTPTYNDMVVKACALALREHARANGSYRDGAMQLHSRVNVGVAVAAHDALVVPTVFDADEKSLGEIARETRELAERVRSQAITPPELGGGTFTVSNLGMYGVKSFTAIINPPQAGILSVGTLEPRAVVREGEVAIRHTLTLTLVCDHRILYGAEAAQFLARIRELLESPSALTL
jgi:pyruvate dehydrogenase E2 component (dihydrolipoamide acetyltransferase)